MIRISELVARVRRPAAVLGPVSFELEAGSSYALVGGREGGVPLLLSILAGTRSPRSGEVTLDGQPPGARKAVACVPLDFELPSVLRVDELLHLAGHVRGERAIAPEERLAVLGVETLAPRRIVSLTPDEAHAVALVLAVTSDAAVLLLEEPFLRLDPRAWQALAEALDVQRLAERKRTVIVATASPEDGRALAHEQLYFERGRLVGRSLENDAWTAAVSLVPRLTVQCEEARTLLTALATEPTFTDVATEGTVLRLEGTDPVAMAKALAHAVRNTGVELDFFEFTGAGGHG